MVRFWVRFESEATGFTDGLGLMGEKKKDHSAASCGTEGERALPGNGKGGIRSSVWNMINVGHRLDI